MTTFSNLQNNSPLPDLPSVGEKQDIGVGRAHQEDRVMLFSLASADTAKRVLVAAIYDGHNSDAMAQLLSTALPAQLLIVFKAHDWHLSNKCFEELFQKQEALAAKAFADGSITTGGSTLLLHVLDGSQLWTAWVGDSRSCLNKDGVHLSVDHCRTNPVEAARFSKAGVTNCELDVTRALGDIDVKLNTKGEGLEGISPLIAVPEVSMRTIAEQDEFIVMGSDGLWDFFKAFTFADIRKELRKSNNCQEAAKLACDSALAAQKHDGGHALRNGDNITVIVIGLKQPAALPTFNKKRSKLPTLLKKGESQSEANGEISVEEGITREEEVIELPQVVEMGTKKAPPFLLNPNAQPFTPAAARAAADNKVFTSQLNPLAKEFIPVIDVKFYNLLVTAQKRWEEKMEATRVEFTTPAGAAAGGGQIKLLSDNPKVKKTYAQALIPGYDGKVAEKKEAMKQKVVGGGGGDAKAQPASKKNKKRAAAHGCNRSRGGRTTNSGGSGKKQQQENCDEPQPEIEECSWKIAAKKRNW
jgi:protein phosphatase PTC2/3